MDEGTNISPFKDSQDVESEVQLQGETDHLRQHLAERDAHIAALEGEFLKATVRATDLEEQLSTWREKYDRLYDSHKRVQKLNQVLEDKLLQMVDKMKGEKSQLTKDIATLSVRLAESKHNVSVLQKENERYKNDMNLAIQLLQCKPDNFVSQKLDNLPVDTQARVSQYVMSKTKVPLTTQSKNGNDIEHFDSTEYEFNISASLMSKILEDSIQDTITKHCDTCTCNKSQSKPFSYNDTHYSVATQTVLKGQMKQYVCLNCSTDIKSVHSNISLRSPPHSIKNINEKTSTVSAPQSIYSIKQPTDEKSLVIKETKKNITQDYDDENISEDKRKLEANVQSENLTKVDNNQKLAKKNINIEPTVHHKLCDRTSNYVASIKGSNSSVVNETLSVKSIPNTKDSKPKENITDIVDNHSLRKNSQSSMGAVSRTSSITKSTSSMHKCNTQVGPGPRFCSLRMQAGSKNILLDNAQPDVPPVLYTRQSKCTDNTLFKDLHEGIENFIDLKQDESMQINARNESIVVESTLIDVHVDNNNKDVSSNSKSSSINPILLNVSSSPLQPLKTHNFLNNTEKNNNKMSPDENDSNASEVINLLNDIDFDVSDKFIDQNFSNTEQKKFETNQKSANTTPDCNGVKIFNFDRYEQKLGVQMKPLRKVDMSQLHTIENTKISKDLPPQGDMPKIQKNISVTAKPLPAIVNVYPNLTQTHLKANESKKVFTNEQSTSSLSSDDSAAVLQKQQLLRVAEWVEQNLEQQNNLNDPSVLEEDINFNKSVRRDSKLSRTSDNLENALKMPHPVSKYSNSFMRDDGANWIVKNIPEQKTDEQVTNITNVNPKTKFTIAKETIFPADSGDTTSVIGVVNSIDEGASNDLVMGLRPGKEITAEELARMEYNVKKFLMSGPHWVNPDATYRSRRTSSKTETDV